MLDRPLTPVARRAWALLLVAALAPACKKDSGSSSPPTLANLALWPRTAGLNDGAGAVSGTFSVDVADAGSDVTSLTLTLSDPAGAELDRATIPLQNPPGATAGTLSGTLMLPTSMLGDYTVSLQAQDAGGARSNTIQDTFTVVPGAPAPVLTGISPSTVEAGATSVTVTATGSGFDGYSSLQWNGSWLSTTYLDSGTLRATVPGYFLSQAGTAQVTAYRAPPGGGISNALPFTVTAPTPRPAPVIGSLSPAAVDAGGPDLILTVTGSGFHTASTVFWSVTYNPLPTTYVSSTELRATVSAAALSAPGISQIGVQTPSPGGGTSATLGFEVRLPPIPDTTVLRLEAKDLAWDPYSQKLYLSVPSTAALNPNTITVVDPFTGGVETSIYAGSEPGSLALSDDGRFLYVGHGGASDITRYALPGLTTDLAIGLGRDGNGNLRLAREIAVAPGAPHTFAVALGSPSWSYGLELAVYDDATPRSGRGGQTSAICWGDDPGTLYGLGGFWAALGVYPVTASGVGQPTSYANAFGSTDRLQYDRTTRLLYGADGRAIDPATGNLTGTFAVAPGSSAMVTDAPLGAAIFATVTSSEYWVDLRVYDLGHYLPLRSKVLSYLRGPVTRMVRWGPDGLALLSQNGLVLVRGALLLPPASADNPSPTVTALSPASVAAGSPNLRLTVAGTGFVTGSVVQVGGADRFTRWVSATELVAYVPASALATAASVTVTVTSPTPGGGTSAASTLTVSP